MNEIEEFLKRAAAMRARQQAEAGPKRPVGQPERPASRPMARLPQNEVLDAEIVEAEEVKGDSVVDYVTSHLGSGGFSRRASTFASDVRSADDAIEAHLHQTFEHRLGQLGGMTPRADDSTLDDEEAAALRAAAVPVPTTHLMDLLRSSENLRVAIVLAEILNPPTHRW